MNVDALERDEVVLTDFDPDGEIKVVAAALYAVSDLPDDQLLGVARRMTPDERANVLRAYVGDRANRRHKPGRAFERTAYRFDILADYGAFRDLQRHRLLTLEWQQLGALHGYVEPDAIEAAGAHDDWTRVMEASADLYDALQDAGLDSVAPYAVSMAYRIRFYMEMNAREAMHLIELRTAPQGHPAYRRICQSMHRLIAEQAGHRVLADAMKFVDHSEVELERLKAERAAEKNGPRRNEKHIMLADGDTYIWYQATDSFDDRATRNAMALLSSAERDNCSRFAFERDRRDYAAAHALLRSALSRYVDAPAHEWRFFEGAGGKPSLLNTGRSPLSFNLSHTHGLVACIVAPGIDVGIDVERVDSRIDHNDLADSFFSPIENLLIFANTQRTDASGASSSYGR